MRKAMKAETAAQNICALQKRDLLIRLYPAGSYTALHEPLCPRQVEQIILNKLSDNIILLQEASS